MDDTEALATRLSVAAALVRQVGSVALLIDVAGGSESISVQVPTHHDQDERVRACHGLIAALRSADRKARVHEGIKGWTYIDGRFCGERIEAYAPELALSTVLAGAS